MHNPLAAGGLYDVLGPFFAVFQRGFPQSGKLIAG
jgi:hypothetical protein